MDRNPRALSFLTNDSLFTLPVALSNAKTGTCGAVQRFYVRGLVSGALKR